MLPSFASSEHCCPSCFFFRPTANKSVESPRPILDHWASNTILPPCLSKKNLLQEMMLVKKNMPWRLFMAGASSHPICIRERTASLSPISISAHIISLFSSSSRISLFMPLPLLVYRHPTWFLCPHNDPYGPSFEVPSLTKSHKKTLNERYINGLSKLGMQIQKSCNVGFHIFAKMRCLVLVWRLQSGTEYLLELELRTWITWIP